MPIPENTLSNWSKQGSSTQFTKTYDTIKESLCDKNAPFNARKFTVFLQGSYKNHTNIPSDSDVDIVIRLDEIFLYDINSLSTSNAALFRSWIRKSEYTLSQFKVDVFSWLKNKFGDDVKLGSKAINIKARGERRDADVLACIEYRRYTRFNSEYDQNYISGICFYLRDGTAIINFPILHSENCTKKHELTRNWFKHSVRIYKNFRNVLIEEKKLQDGLAPSYFIEGLLYNVPPSYFGGTEQENFTDVINWLASTDKTKFSCANEQHPLFDSSSNVSWRLDECSKLIKAMIDYWNAY